MDNPWLIVGGVLSLLAAALHVAIIYKGPAWYRLFGAGERMATLAEQGKLEPALITASIALVLLLWALYAFSGAGLLPPFPLLDWALAGITLIYLLRGVLPMLAAVFMPQLRTPFIWWSSLICTVYGLCHAVGLFILLVQSGLPRYD